MKKFNKQKVLLILISLLTISKLNGYAAKLSVGDGFSIDASIKSIKYKKAYLCSRDKGVFNKTDSAAIKSGSFSFKGKVKSPKMFYIMFDNNQDDKINLFLENSAITISGTDLKTENIKVTGSVVHSDYQRYLAGDDKYREQYSAMNKNYDEAEKKGDTLSTKKIELKLQTIDSLRIAAADSFILSNTKSTLAAYLIISNTYRFELEKLEKFYGTLSDEVKASDYGVKINTTIVKLNKIKIGQPAPNFTLNDVNGKPVSLSDFKGKYVLVDFWASWCGPCRAENPNVVKAYNTFKDKGFTILGVSLDSKREKWLKAIEKDKLTWTHVSDLKGWGSEAADLYSVSGIPFSVLVDKDGIIVEKDLRGEALTKKLEEVLSK